MTGYLQVSVSQIYFFVSSPRGLAQNFTYSKFAYPLNASSHKFRRKRMERERRRLQCVELFTLLSYI